MTTQRVTQIWADTVRQRACESGRCRRSIYFAQNVRTGNYMPFSTRPVPIAVQAELETGREKWTVDLAQSHFADCPGAQGFRRRR